MNFAPVIQHTVPIEVAALSFDDVTAETIEVECVLWGDLSKPLIVLMGGISANRWALDCHHHDQPGWWNQVFNQHSCLNSNEYCFLTFEYFAFPERITNPPIISTMDQARILHQIQTQLNLPHFHAVIGSSYGGMVSLVFASEYPDSLGHLLCIAAADQNSVKSQALRQIQRSIIDLGNQFAHCSHDHKQFVALARSLAMIGYRGEAEWEQRFQAQQSGDSLAQVSSYLSHHGQQFADRFSASRYCQLSQSIDFHSVDVSGIKANTLLIGINSDQMVPVDLINNMSEKFNHSCQTHFIDSIYGHDGFLLEPKQLNQTFQTFLSENNHDNSERNRRCASGY